MENESFIYVDIVETYKIINVNFWLDFPKNGKPIFCYLCDGSEEMGVGGEKGGKLPAFLKFPLKRCEIETLQGLWYRKQLKVC